MWHGSCVRRDGGAAVFARSCFLFGRDGDHRGKPGASRMGWNLSACAASALCFLCFLCSWVLGAGCVVEMFGLWVEAGGFGFGAKCRVLSSFGLFSRSERLLDFPGQHFLVLSSLLTSLLTNHTHIHILTTPPPLTQ